MRTRPARLLFLLVSLGGGLLGLPACSGVASLNADSPRLTAAERGSVHGQVEKAMAQKRFNLAWEQEVAAGADRARLETIAVAALRERSRHAGEMLDALRERHGGLTPEARAEVSQEVAAAQQAERWSRAVEIELLAAEDPPAYEAAWTVYRAAPAGRAPPLLEAIVAAKEAHAESDD